MDGVADHLTRKRLKIPLPKISKGSVDLADDRISRFGFMEEFRRQNRGAGEERTSD